MIKCSNSTIKENFQPIPLLLKKLEGKACSKLTAKIISKQLSHIIKRHCGIFYQLCTKDIGAIALLPTFTIVLWVWKNFELMKTSYTPYTENNDSLDSILEHLSTLSEVRCQLYSKPATCSSPKIKFFHSYFFGISYLSQRYLKVFFNIPTAKSQLTFLQLKNLFKEVSDYLRHYLFSMYAIFLKKLIFFTP